MISLERIQILFIAIASLLLPVPAAYTATPYYEGKTIRIIVGTAPGGGYDTYTRLLARHFSKHIPGTPNVIVDNMPGAGGLLSANYMYRVAKADGLTSRSFCRRAVFTATPRPARYRVRCPALRIYRRASPG